MLFEWRERTRKPENKKLKLLSAVGLIVKRSTMFLICCLNMLRNPMAIALYVFILSVFYISITNLKLHTIFLNVHCTKKWYRQRSCCQKRKFTKEDNLSRIQLFVESSSDCNAKTFNLSGCHSISTCQHQFWPGYLTNFSRTSRPDQSINSTFLNVMMSECIGRVNYLKEPSLDMGLETEKCILCAGQQLTTSGGTSSWFQAYKSNEWLFQRNFTYAIEYREDGGHVNRLYVPELGLSYNIVRNSLIQGSGGSVFLNSINGFMTVKEAKPNLSLKAFDVIDTVKEMVVAEGPATVSCSVILVLAARDKFALVGGPYYITKSGQKDSVTSNFYEILNQLPVPDDNLYKIEAIFVDRGCDERGAATLFGTLDCHFLTDCLTNSSGTVRPAPSFLNVMMSKCIDGQNGQEEAGLDMSSQAETRPEFGSLQI